MDTTFGKRLNIACDGHPDVPPYGQGRQTWVKREMEVSNEAVRKWFKDEARPKPGKMKQLADLLGVDEAWLALGIQPEMTPVEKKKRNARVNGSVNIVAGFIQLNGGSIAFPPNDENKVEFVDLYAIIEGQQYAVHVSMAEPMADAQFKFYIPPEVEKIRTIGVVVISPVYVHLVNLKPSIVDKHKIRRGGYYEVEIRREGDMYFSGDDQWPRIMTFNGTM